jgi:hypothetical protein
MQRSWRDDADKLTFIICTAPTEALEKLEPGKQDSPESMIGDINLFLNVDDEDENQAEGNNAVIQQDMQGLVGEVEIMIAQKTFQGKGLGKTTLLIFLWYIISSLDDIMKEYHVSHSGGRARSYLKYLRVKIDHENIRSLRLFESAGFKKTSSTPNYFGELELRRPISTESRKAVEGKLHAMPLIADY